MSHRRTSTARFLCLGLALVGALLSGCPGAQEAETTRPAEAMAQPQAAEARHRASDAGPDGAEPPTDGGGAPEGGPDAAGEALPTEEAGALPPPDGVVADWSDRRVTVYVGGERRASYPAIFGKQGIGKEVRGDEKTPGGTYRLQRGRASQYHRFLPVSYPSTADGRRGYEAKLISKAQLRGIERADKRGRLTPQGTKLGGQVGIHGFGKGLTELAALFRKLPRAPSGTRGCIMILDENVDELEKLVRPGVTLVIRQ